MCGWEEWDLVPSPICGARGEVVPLGGGTPLGGLQACICRYEMRLQRAGFCEQWSLINVVISGWAPILPCRSLRLVDCWLHRAGGSEGGGIGGGRGGGGQL